MDDGYSITTGRKQRLYNPNFNFENIFLSPYLTLLCAQFEFSRKTHSVLNFDVICFLTIKFECLSV